MSEMDSLIERSKSCDMNIDDDKYHDNTEAHNAFAAFVEKPIELGLVLVMLEMERLSKEDPEKYRILHDWLVEKLGYHYHVQHIASGYAKDSHNDVVDKDGKAFYKVREEYLQALANPNKKIYC